MAAKTPPFLPKRPAGPEYAGAFAFSTTQDDYRWGRLHRIVFSHTLDDPFFNIPTAGGSVPSPLPGLPGFPTDGARRTVDVAGGDVRTASADDWMFEDGASIRFVAQAGPGHVRAWYGLPGGASGNPLSPLYANLLPAWLTNDASPVLFLMSQIVQNLASTTVYVPGH